MELIASDVVVLVVAAEMPNAIAKEMPNTCAGKTRARGMAR